MDDTNGTTTPPQPGGILRRAGAALAAQYHTMGRRLRRVLALYAIALVPIALALRGMQAGWTTGVIQLLVGAHVALFLLAMAQALPAQARRPSPNRPGRTST